MKKKQKQTVNLPHKNSKLFLFKNPNNNNKNNNNDINTINNNNNNHKM